MSRIVLLFLFFHFHLYAVEAFGQQRLVDPDRLELTHDIQSLSSWGPYSKKYAGISHIADPKKGITFDFTIAPGYYYHKTLVPDVRFESAYHPWEASADLKKITYRYSLEWKDQVYADVTYRTVDSSTVLVAINCVNNTPIQQSLSLNTLASLAYPENYPHLRLTPREGAMWMNALSYADLTYARPSPRDGLVYDGWILGEVRTNEYIDGRALAKRFGEIAGDRVRYSLDLPPDGEKGVVRFRYRVREGDTAQYKATGLVNAIITFKGTGKFEWLEVPYMKEAASETAQLELISLGNAAIELNGFLLGSAHHIKAIHTDTVPHTGIPEMMDSNRFGQLLLKYPEAKQHYGIAWEFPSTLVREIRGAEPGLVLKENEHNTTKRSIYEGLGEGHAANIFMRPIRVEPKDSTKVFMLICKGEKTAVEHRMRQLRRLIADWNTENETPVEEDSNILPAGIPYLFSQKMMQATLLTNVAYPIYTQNQFIRHFTPGKRWNSLYTWDSGFIALGMSEIDLEKAVQCLNAYTTPVGSQSAFIHHGSPVPVQLFVFLDLWNKTQSKEVLKYLYPRLKQYYAFLAGNTHGSTTRTLQSGLLKTWDYFYNSGGWDDYPPQVAVHEQKLSDSVAPVITTAHVIRVAKILRLAADALGIPEDIIDYQKDIDLFEQALQTNAWDAQSGYFGYVRHDADGKATGILRSEHGDENYNMGLDGVYPLMAGICSQEQQDTLLDRLFSPDRLWTPAGISAVDQSASYYSLDGYWNGWVWMPHQWFMWKTMLDIGQVDRANQIASNALEIWKREVDANYHTYELFQANTAKGAGWHHFSGLSSPVLTWFNAYYKIGTVSTGFEVWIDQQSFTDDYTTYEATLTFDNATAAHVRSLIVCMSPSKTYRAFFRDKEIAVKSSVAGQLFLDLPATNEKGILKISSIK